MLVEMDLFDSASAQSIVEGGDPPEAATTVAFGFESGLGAATAANIGVPWCPTCLTKLRKHDPTLVRKLRVDTIDPMGIFDEKAEEATAELEGPGAEHPEAAHK